MNPKNHELESIPKHSNGKINVAEYRELSWYRQQRMNNHLAELNGRVGKSEERIAPLEKFVGRFKFIGSLTIKLTGGIAVLLGLIKTILVIMK